MAIPLIIAHGVMIGLEIIDTVMAGRFSAEDLAVGGNIWLMIEVCVGGFLAGFIVAARLPSSRIYLKTRRVCA